MYTVGGFRGSRRGMVCMAEYIHMQARPRRVPCRISVGCSPQEIHRHQTFPQVGEYVLGDVDVLLSTRSEGGWLVGMREEAVPGKKGCPDLESTWFKDVERRDDLDNRSRGPDRANVLYPVYVCVWSAHGRHHHVWANVGPVLLLVWSLRVEGVMRAMRH